MSVRTWCKSVRLDIIPRVDTSLIKSRAGGDHNSPPMTELLRRLGEVASGAVCELKPRTASMTFSICWFFTASWSRLSPSCASWSLRRSVHCRPKIPSQVSWDRTLFSSVIVIPSAGAHLDTSINDRFVQAVHLLHHSLAVLGRFCRDGVQAPGTQSLQKFRASDTRDLSAHVPKPPPSCCCGRP